MKTYLFDTINRYKRFSESLDIRTTLCNKSWWVFNDSGVKSLYIFQDNGDLYITTNGVGIRGTWQYIAANKTVIINSENAVMMFHPSFIDDNILTLTLDGTNNCAFLIDENNRANFSPNSLSDLTKYFQKKEQKEIEAKKEEERKKKEEEERRRQEEENKRRQKEENRLKEEAQQLRNELDGETNSITFFLLFIIWLFVSGFIHDGICYLFNIHYNESEPKWLFYIIMAPTAIVILILYQGFCDYILGKKIAKWKMKHANDPRNKYL